IVLPSIMPCYLDAFAALFPSLLCLFFLLVTATSESYTLSLHDALPIFNHRLYRDNDIVIEGIPLLESLDALNKHIDFKNNTAFETHKSNVDFAPSDRKLTQNNYFKLMNQFLKPDRKSTRLNSSHVSISYAVCCL